MSFGAGILLPQRYGNASGDPFAGAALNLNMLAGSLDSRVTFSRGTNATLTDRTGKIVYAPANLMLRSQEFNDASWTSEAGSVTANNAVAPDGNLTADLFVPDATSSVVHRVRQTATTTPVTHMISVFAKGGGYSKLGIREGSVTGAYATFNLSGAGSVIEQGSGGTATIVAVGNGWYRATVSFAAGTAARMDCYALPDAYTSGNPVAYAFAGNGTSGVLLWGAQLEPITYQTAPGSYVATTSAAYYGPRFDYSPISLMPLGLLVEEDRTNLVLRSQEFDDAAWSKSSADVTANNIISPDGSLNADRITSTGLAALAQSAVSTNTSHTFTVFAKQGSGAGEGSRFLLRNETTATNLVGILMDYSTGSFSYIAGTSGATVTPVGNGWWRITISATSGITVGNVLVTYVGFTGGGSAGQFMYAYGAQLEAGAFATSYIPTAASTVLRSADVATMTGTNFSSWFNASAGTFVSSFDVIGSATTGGLLRRHVWNGSDAGNQRLSLRALDTATNAPIAAIGTGVGVTSLNGAALTVNVPASIAVAYGTNTALSQNGATPATDPSAASVSISSLDIGSNIAATLFLNGHIRQIAYFNTRLPNAQLQGLTA